MRKLNVFRHIPVEDIGLIGPVLADKSIEVEYCDLYRGHPSPDIEGSAGLVFMGGPMSANDDLPYINQEIALIRDAAGRGKPVLGVCLGAQLIARALGARIYRNPVKEIGWFDLHLRDEAGTDPLFRGLQPTEVVFQWHGETFDLPSGAAWLAYSDACAHQAFRAGDRVYGLQFHLEVTPEMITSWVHEDANCGDVRELSSPIDPFRNQARLEQLSRTVFGRWCDLL